MHKFQNQLKAIFEKLGFTDKAKTKAMTAADWAAVAAAYKEAFGVEMSDDQATYVAERDERTNNTRLETENAEALNIVTEALNSINETPTSNGDAPNADLVSCVRQLSDAVSRMSKEMLPDNAPAVKGSVISLNGPGHSTDYFGGIEHPMFAMSHRYNRIAVNHAYAALNPVNETSDGKAFRKELHNYSELLAARINSLRKENALNKKAMVSATEFTFDSTGVGDQYLIRRMDQLIARLVDVQNVYDIFPRRFGVQDREAMVNAFFGDFSQAYQAGQVWKGSIALKPEICYVDDAMFKTLFASMKDLERQYIGYLNKEGSDPIKWTMIEWAMLTISTKLIKEQNERKIMGIFMRPEPNIPGHKLNSGTGVYYTLLRYYNEGKIALVDDAAYSNYTSGQTMVECVVNMMSLLAEKVKELDTYEVILNKNHQQKWKSGVRDIYGKDNDFTGPDGDVVPDTAIKIRWCPYMDQLPLIIVQQPGNIQSIEFEPGEMHNIQFDADMESVKAWSVWKEGTSAAFAGKPFASKAACKANDFADQMIFMNKPAVTIAADATAVTATGDFRHYVTAENTKATAITDITGAKPGFAYLIEIGSETNASSIAKSGKFADITAEFTPTAVGDYILVALNSAETKFIELERCVGGTRSINTDVRPNVPGGR